MDFILTRLPYIYVILLFVIGLYGILGKRNLVKKLIGINIMQAAVILFFINYAFKWKASIPIRSDDLPTAADSYMNPIPHALMLTAIVVSVATTGLALTLLRKIYQRNHSLDEPECLH